MFPRRLLALLLLILVSILPFAVSAQTPPAATSDWCPPSVQNWLVTFSLTGHGNLVWDSRAQPAGAVVPGTADAKITGKIKFIAPSGTCVWVPSAFGPGDVSASVSVTGTDFTDPSCPVNFWTAKGMGATGSGLMMQGAVLSFNPPGSDFLFGLFTPTLDVTQGITFQCTGFTFTSPTFPARVGPANPPAFFTFSLPAGGPQSFSVTKQFQAEDQYGDPQMLWTLTLNLTSDCPPLMMVGVHQSKPHNRPFIEATVPIPPVLDAQGLPVPGVDPLKDYAASCGFDSIEWQQQLTTLPGPSPFFPRNPALIDANHNLAQDGSLMASPNYPLHDPVPGGYGYLAASYDPYPFVYPDFSFAPGAGCTVPLPPQMPCAAGAPLIFDGNTLSFLDSVLDGLLKGVSPNNPPPPPGAFIGLWTSLVGVSHQPRLGSQSCGDPNLGTLYPDSVLYCTPLHSFTWISTYNGGKGGISITSQTATIDLNDSGNGSGGITITSIDGVPQTPPGASCTINPTTLWPPNGQSVEVTVSGTITAGTQPIPADGMTFTVADKDGQDQPNGNFTVASDSSYSFEVPLIAARNGNDKDGRTYTVNVIVRDQIGNTGTCSAVVTVPHDLGH